MLGCIVAAALAGSMIHSFVTRKQPDIPYMMIGIGPRPDIVTEALDEFLAERFGDLNSDGTVYYKGDYIDLDVSETADPQMVQANTTRFAGTLASRACALLIYTEGTLDLYEWQDSLVYLDLTQHGIRADGDTPERADVTDHPAIVSAGFSGIRIFAGVVAYSDLPGGLLSEQQLWALDAIRALAGESP